jgi:hypothetical protein
MAEIETGWLIECREENGIEWWSLPHAVGEWTKDASAALRFARRVDAEAYAHSAGLDDCGFTTYITEHEWSDPTRSATARDAVGSGQGET